MHKSTTIAALTLTAALFAGACTVEPTAKPIKQAAVEKSPAAEEPAAVNDAPSACDVVREALLTGTQAQIDAAMAALKADTTADGKAREYADYYLGRDAADPQMREMDTGIIRMYCDL